MHHVGRSLGHHTGWRTSRVWRAPPAFRLNILESWELGVETWDLGLWPWELTDVGGKLELGAWKLTSRWRSGATGGGVVQKYCSRSWSLDGRWSWVLCWEPSAAAWGVTVGLAFQHCMLSGQYRERDPSSVLSSGCTCISQLISEPGHAAGRCCQPGQLSSCP
jgi:hypothetical protein